MPGDDYARARVGFTWIRKIRSGKHPRDPHAKGDAFAGVRGRVRGGARCLDVAHIQIYLGSARVEAGHGWSLEQRR